MKVVVAGAAGFVGSHLVEALLKRGDLVVGIDSLVTGRRENLTTVALHPNFELIICDAGDSALQHQLSVMRPDAIIDLASPASPSDFLRIPEIILHAGSVVVMNLLGIAKATGARFVFASSSEVYGDPEIHPQHEEYLGAVSTSGPRSCYDESKRFAEAAITSLGRKFEIGFGVARLFNTYGPRMRADDGRVVSNFIHAALANRPLTIYGSGKQTRSFCYVSDTVSGLMALTSIKENIIVNIGNPVELTIEELADLVKAVSGSTSEIQFVDLPSERVGDPRRRKPDIRRANQLLDWRPVVGIAEGLTNYLSFLSSSDSTRER